MSRKVIVKENDEDLEETLEIGVSDFRRLIDYAEWAYDQATRSEAVKIREFLDEMAQYLAPDEPEVEWVTVVPLNGAPFVATHFDLNEDDDEVEFDDDELLVGWKWSSGKKRIGTWDDLLSLARSKKAKILLPGESL